MRKLLLLSAFAMGMVSASAADTTFLWGSSLYTDDKQNSIFDCIQSSDGNIYIAASIKPATECQWMGKTTQLAEQTAENDYNLFIPKLDADGNMLWHLLSTVGNFKTNSVNIAPTSDGGLILTAIVRHNKNEYDGNLIELLQADGTVYTVAGPESNGNWMDYGLIMRISGSGQILWDQIISQSTDYTGCTVKITSGFEMGSLAVDDNDNIYIGGRYLNALTLPGNVTLSEGHNAPTKFTASLSVGDGWIAKLSGTDGKTLATYRASDCNNAKYAASDNVKELAWHNGTLYFVNIVTPLSGVTPGFMGHTVATGTAAQPVYGAVTLSNDATAFPQADYVKTAETASGSTIQINGIKAGGGRLIIMGSLKGSLSGDGVTIASAGNQLEGFFIDTKTPDGTIEVAGTAGNTISGFSNTIVDRTSGNYIMLGYNLSNGYLMETFDNTGKSTETQYLATGNGMFGIPSATFNNATKQLVIAARSNKNIEFAGTTATGNDAISVYTAFAASYILDVNDAMSGIEDVASDIIPDEDAPVEYYNLQGIRVNNPANGIFIRRQGSKVEKIIMR